MHLTVWLRASPTPVKWGHVTSHLVTGWWLPQLMLAYPPPAMVPNTYPVQHALLGHILTPPPLPNYRTNRRSEAGKDAIERALQECSNAYLILCSIWRTFSSLFMVKKVDEIDHSDLDYSPSWAILRCWLAIETRQNRFGLSFCLKNDILAQMVNFINFFYHT